MASETPTGFLTVTVGAFGRTTSAGREGAARAVNISHCPVTGWTVFGSADNKVDGRSFRADERLHVCIMEAEPGETHWKEEPEKIGALIIDHMLANIYLPPDAFAHFWAAAEATHGSSSNMQIELKPGGQDYLNVTSVGLTESMSGSQLHPVVAELRVMREKAKSIVVGFAVVLIAWILLSIFRHF